MNCPQWCYVIFPPPPPLDDEFPDDNNSSPIFSPLVIAIIVASAFLLYKKGDGLIEGTDCSVCLSEFQEDESLRLLPNAAALPPLPPPVMESLQANESSQDSHRTNGNAAVTQDIERVVSEEEIEQNNGGDSKTPLRVFSDLGNLQERAAIIQIRDERYPPVRRSFSMDHPCQNRCLAADILQMNQDEVILVEDCLSGDAAESSKRSAQVTKHSHRRESCIMY
ncbi:hypothetical protein GH714_021231 [Hevea brasiliensis]|uniref:RING-type E3 ubiquitin transferase n=1 Tax=Hevea brasiliensis TaxID=3981 RepID=A0A6A6M595_HEVBR|nr:hypothetical protein GH714_021231 [Hevea brasiliensis]